MRAVLSRVSRHARSLGLAALGLGCIQRGIAYLIPGQPRGPAITGALQLLTLEGTIPYALIALAWILTGAFALVCAATRRLTRTAGNLVGGILFAWGLAYLVAWITDIGEPTGWISAGTYIWFALAILAWTHLVDPVLRTH